MKWWKYQVEKPKGKKPRILILIEADIEAQESIEGGEEDE